MRKINYVMSLKNLRLLNPYTVSLKRVLRWTISPTAWDNEDLELQRRDGGFVCRDGKKLLIYGAHTSLLVSCWL